MYNNIIEEYPKRLLEFAERFATEEAIKEGVELESTVQTDSWGGYVKLGGKLKVQLRIFKNPEINYVARPLYLEFCLGQEDR